MKKRLIDGYSSRVTARGYRVVELDARADPARGVDWHTQAKAKATSEADFQREIMRNWNITSGDAYYPEFGQFGREGYLYEPPSLLRSPVIRGWDFGWRAPVCVWMQYSQKADRLYVLREFAPKGIAAAHFLEICLHLSNAAAYEELDATSREWVDMLAGLPEAPTPPWFPPRTEFIDLSGNEVNNVQSIAAKDPREATLRNVWSNRGVNLSIQAGPVKARADVFRRLLYPRGDGWPGVVISKHCTEVLAMLDGGLAYKRPTQINPKPEEPRKDGRFDNVHDALTYGVVGTVPASAPDAVDLSGWEDGDMGWAETAGRDR